MKLFLAITTLIITNTCFAQKRFNFGAMVNYENTTLSVPNGKFVVYSNGGISEQTNSTGYRPSMGIGLYGRYVFDCEWNHSISLDLFYDKTSSKQFSDVNFHAINVIPYFDLNLFKSNIHLNLGFGLGFILNKVELNNEERVQNNIDVIGKLGLQYFYKDYIIIEIGKYPPIKEVVKDYFGRDKYYFGVKIPLDEYFEN